MRGSDRSGRHDKSNNKRNASVFMLMRAGIGFIRLVKRGLPDEKARRKRP